MTGAARVAAEARAAAEEAEYLRDERQAIREADSAPDSRTRGPGQARARSSNSKREHTAERSGWRQPLAFEELDTLPTFPVNTLPETIRTWVEEECVATQTPVDLPAFTAIATMSAITAQRVEVRVRQGWTEPLNIWAVVALAPGNRKSPVFSHATAPLLQHEREEATRLAASIHAATALKRVREKALEAAIKKAANTGSPEDKQLAAELGVELGEFKIPVAPRFAADDVTPEQLAALLSLHGGRMAILSAEGGIFETIAGRYTDGVPNLDVFLKGHSGDPLRVDRVSRPPLHIPRPTLTLGLTVQPEVISGLATKPGFRGRGLLARFFYSLPQSLVGRRDVEPPTVEDSTIDSYCVVMRRLLMLTQQDEAGEPRPTCIDLEDEARDVLMDFAREIEPQLASGGTLGLFADWGGKLVGGVARIACLLHVADCANSANTETGNWTCVQPVGPDAVNRAIEVGRYLMAHAGAAFQLMGTDPDLEAAKHLLAWIVRSGQKLFTKRDAFEATKGRFKRAFELDRPLEILCERYYVRPVASAPRAGPGRSPSPKFEVNPRTHNSHNSQNRGSA